MNPLPRSLLIALAVLAALASESAAQIVEGWRSKQVTMEVIDADRVRLMREVEVIGEGPNAGQQIFADELLWNIRTGEFSAEGNVLVVSPTGRIAAERVTFNTKTRLGTFYTASGIAALGDRAVQDKSMFGTLEPDVYFYGERIDKIGDDKYRITKGGFTTCVQPTPRWEIVSNTMTIKLEDYAVLRNAVVRVKDVPVFYLPVLYYPIQSDDRATGFLLPTYGNSVFRGHSVSNAFFWATGRSHDVLFTHDWFLGRGQGMGAEYRYLLAPGSEGEMRFYWLNEKSATFDVLGNAFTTPERRSFEVRGGVVQNLGRGLVARVRADYFSDIAVRQLYNNNYFQDVGSRTYSGTVTGSWAGVTVNGSVGRTESISGLGSSSVTGSKPGVSASLSSRQLGTLPIFVAADGDAVDTIYRNIYPNRTDDFGLVRASVKPIVRARLSTLPFLQFNSAVTWHYSYYNESLDENRQQTEGPISRQYFQFSANAIGPVINRIFRMGSGSRIKHSIEPLASIDRITSIPVQRQVPVQSNTYDYVVGGSTRMTYGIGTRLVKRDAQPTGESGGAPLEFFTISVQQSYYTNSDASLWDSTYGYAFFNRASSYSPVRIDARVTPTRGISTELRAEYDTTTGEDKLLGMSLLGRVSGKTVSASGGWNQTRFRVGANIQPDNYLRGGTEVKARDGALMGTFGFNYDVKRRNLLQMRWSATYNAQCCGLVVEYQTFNFAPEASEINRFPLSRDRRINIGFTLAGIGTFANFLGAFGVGRY